MLTVSVTFVTSFLVLSLSFLSSFISVALYKFGFVFLLFFYLFTFCAIDCEVGNAVNFATSFQKYIFLSNKSLTPRIIYPMKNNLRRL